MANFMGKDGFVWWQGVVEDRQDPLYLGRCRVRILGWDTEDNQLARPNVSKSDKIILAQGKAKGVSLPGIRQ